MHQKIEGPLHRAQFSGQADSRQFQAPNAVAEPQMPVCPRPGVA
jgi:hypothetical protein